jgi:aminopeptidase N
MRTDTPLTIYRKDYTAPSYLVDTVELGFDLDPARTVVANRMTLQRNPASAQREIELYGEDIELVAIRLNGKTLAQGDYRIDGNLLRIANTPDKSRWKSKPSASRRTTRRSAACTLRTAVSIRSARPRASAASPISRTVRT